MAAHAASRMAVASEMAFTFIALGSAIEALV